MTPTIPGGKKKLFFRLWKFFWRCKTKKKKQPPWRCLDAAHGKTVGAVRVVQRVHVTRIEVQVPRVDIARSVRRGRPIIAAAADARQVSRLTVAVARGSERSNRWNECTEEADPGSLGTDWDG